METDEVDRDEEMEQSDEEMMDDKIEEEEEAEESNEKEVYLPGKTLEKNEELVVDLSAYRMLHRAQTGAPCLSFDIISDDLGELRESYPISMFLVAGTQAPKTHVNNLLVMKMTNLTGNEEPEDGSDDDSSESDDDDDDEKKKEPVMSVASIKHQGCVNRVRVSKLSDATFVASWSELGRVNIWNLTEQLKALESPASLAIYNKTIEKSNDLTKPLFTFKGHTAEGYGLDWCPTELGTLASGDCKGNIHLWRHSNGTWQVDNRSYNSHSPESVEDLQWSPNERHVLASCSVDKK